MKTIKDINWATLTCKESSSLAPSLPCGASAVAIVLHPADSKAYAMCVACASHNLHGRGAILLAKKKGVTLYV